MNMYINMCILIIMYMSMSFTAIDYNNTISLMQVFRIMNIVYLHDI